MAKLFRGGIASPLGLALMAPEAAGDTKKYIRQQRLARVKGRVPPGGVPDMKKISAHQALRHFLHKEAGPTFGFRQAMGSLPGALALGAGLAGGGLLAAGGAKGVGGVFQKFQGQRMFAELRRRYPEVKRHPKAREYFDMIVAYAPSLMRHPTAIGDFLKRQLEYPMTSVEFIKQLADLEGTVAKTQTYGMATQFGRGVETGAAGVMSPMAQFGKGGE